MKKIYPFLFLFLLAIITIWYTEEFFYSLILIMLIAGFLYPILEITDYDDEKRWNELFSPKNLIYIITSILFLITAIIFLLLY